MNYYYLLLMVIVVSAQKDEESLGKEIENAAIATGHPEIAAAIELMKEIRGESSMTIGSRQDTKGFININNEGNQAGGSVYLKDLDLLVKIWLEDRIFAYVPSHFHSIIALAIKEYALQIKSDNYYRQEYKFAFNNGKGSLVLFAFSLKPHPSIADAVQWQKFILNVDFEVAAPYVIVTNSDCNLFSCDRYDEIVYMPAVVTDEHIQSIIELNIRLLREFAPISPF